MGETKGNASIASDIPITVCPLIKHTGANPAGQASTRRSAAWGKFDTRTCAVDHVTGTLLLRSYGTGKGRHKVPHMDELDYNRVFAASIRSSAIYFTDEEGLS